MKDQIVSEPSGIAAVTKAAANAATYTGGGTAVFFGLSSGQWQALGVLGGLVIGGLGLLVKSVMDWHFRNQHLKLAQSRAKVLADMGDDPA